MTNTDVSIISASSRMIREKIFRDIFGDVVEKTMIIDFTTKQFLLYILFIKMGNRADILFRTCLLISLSVLTVNSHRNPLVSTCPGEGKCIQFIKISYCKKNIFMYIQILL